MATRRILTRTGCLDASDTHLNPAVILVDKFSWKKVPGYMPAQVLGTLAGRENAYGLLHDTIQALFNSQDLSPLTGDLLGLMLYTASLPRFRTARSNSRSLQCPSVSSITSSPTYCGIRTCRYLGERAYTSSPTCPARFWRRPIGWWSESGQAVYAYIGVQMQA